MNIYKYINQLGYSDNPDYEVIKKFIRQSLAENCNSSKLGNWEPFSSKSLRKAYFNGKLELIDLAMEADTSSIE